MIQKIYALALISTLALSASAARTVFPQNAEMKQSAIITDRAATPQRTKAVVSMQKIADFNGSAAYAPASRADEYDIEGQYLITLGDYYYDDGYGDITEEITIEFDPSDMHYYMVPVDTQTTYFVTEVAFDFDKTTNTLTFFKIGFGSVGAYYPLFTPFEWTGQTTYLDTLNAYFDPATGVIDFGEDVGFAWVGCSNPDYTEIAGTYNMFDVIRATQQYDDSDLDMDEEQVGKWTSIGNAEFVDGWILPSWNYNPNFYAYEVEVQQNNSNHNVYRLWRPYKTAVCPVAAFNTSIYKGQIVFDLTDPDHVVFEAGYPAGYNDSYYNTEFYNYGTLGWNLYPYSNDREWFLPYVIDFMIENDQPFDTFDKETGVVTCTLPVFDTVATCEEAYSWPAGYSSYIALPIGWDSVRNVDIDANNAPVEYFNLQGIRIAEPAAGTVVIRRQGADIRKVAIR